MCDRTDNDRDKLISSLNDTLNDIDHWSGAAKANASQHLPWLLPNDFSTIIAVQQDGAKKPTCLAELVCESARSHGIMQVSVTDHDIQQMTQDLRVSFWFLLHAFKKSQVQHHKHFATELFRRMEVLPTSATRFRQ